VQQVQQFGLGDFARRLEFWNWIDGKRWLHRHSLFTDEVQANHDGTNNTILICCQKRTHTTQKNNFQFRSSVKVCFGVLDDQLSGPFIFEGRLTGEMYL